MSSYLDLAPIKRVHGTVKLPGSKSISNRMLLLAALAQGVTVLRDVLDADDTRVMIDGLKKLGVHIEGNTDVLHVQGVEGAFPVKHAELFLGNAGTAFRPLTAALALSGGEYTLSGVARMHERPIKDLVDALAQLGARITYLQNAGYPPLRIEPAFLKDEQPQVTIRGDVSSQFLTALLMSAPLTGRIVTIIVEGELISRPYIAITLDAMHRFGIDVESTENTYTVLPAVYRSPEALQVEGDASAASYFLAAGVIADLQNAGSPASSPQNAGSVKVEGVGRNSVQGDVRFADALEQMGAQITWDDHSISANAGIAAKRAGRLQAFDMDFNHIPDAAMTAAICALFADGACTLRNIGSWRVKETDRIAAMATELRKLGATVEEGKDWLRITPPASRLTPHASINTYDDHRMAMCFSLVTLGEKGVPVRINNPECVAKTFPDYFKVFASIAAK